MSRAEGVLVTAAATVGRFRPVHGELWLLEHGLLYRRLGLRRTARQLRKERGRRAPPRTVDPADRPRERFDPADLDRAAAVPGGCWIPREQMRAARLRRRPTVARLCLELAGGERVVLSWPRHEQATPAVEQQVRGWLGEDLDAR
jgi:hypothetical protein